MDAAKPKIVPKPWGRDVWYARTDRYAGKILEVDDVVRLEDRYGRVDD